MTELRTIDLSWRADVLCMCRFAVVVTVRKRSAHFLFLHILLCVLSFCRLLPFGRGEQAVI